MRLLIECHHPADIHFFKNAVKVWRSKGADLLMVARDRDVMKSLLKAYDWIPYEIPTAAQKKNIFPVGEMIKRQGYIFNKIRTFKPDAVISLMGSYTQCARILKVPNIIFTDSEFQRFNHVIAHPFATRIYTPECFYKKLGPKQRRYKGYHELAFLHPEYYKPSVDILTHLGGVKKGEYVILRLSSWNTLHDIGQKGVGKILKKYVKELSERITTFILPEEGILPSEFEQYRLKIPPERFHDALAFSRLVISEGASTASEAACLGVPAVFINTSGRGYLNDQEKRYGLVMNFRYAETALDKIIKMLDEFGDPARFTDARKHLLSDHIDVTRYLVDEVERICNNKLEIMTKSS